MGSKEYDLIKEIGYGNWIDAVAGEALLLGFNLVDPELEAMGVELASLVREIKYDSDRFYLVEAKAVELQKYIAEIRVSRSKMFIDSIGKSERKHFANNDWNFELLCINGRYQIEICLPNFYSDSDLASVVPIEDAVSLYFEEGAFGEDRKEVENKKIEFTGQKFVTTKFRNSNGVVIRRIIIHNHEQDYGRGFKEDFFFAEFTLAMMAWRALKERLTSGQK